MAGPPATRPAASAGPTYFLTVFRSTPRLLAISAFERPAYQWIRISTMSTTVNVLLISSPSSDWTLESFGSEDRVGKLIEGVGNYLIATALRLGNSVIVSTISPLAFS